MKRCEALTLRNRGSSSKKSPPHIRQASLDHAQFSVLSAREPIYPTSHPSTRTGPMDFAASATFNIKIKSERDETLKPQCFSLLNSTDLYFVINALDNSTQAIINEHTAGELR
jgi:hypothetical protein